MSTWVVCDMDDGLLRRDLPTRKAALRWALNLYGGSVLERHQYGVGDYEYQLGHRGEDARDSVYILREKNMDGPSAGWDPKQRPLYPYADQPYERVERPKCDHCSADLHRAPNTFWWVGADETSDCPSSERGHEVEGSPR